MFVYGQPVSTFIRVAGVFSCLVIGVGLASSSVFGATVTSRPLPEIKSEDASSLWVIPNDPLWSQQWYMRQTGADKAWTVTTGTSNVIVAIIDVGVDITHPDLRESIWTNDQEREGDGIDNDENGFIDDVHGWNFVERSPYIQPIYAPGQSEEAWSHGTMVASLIGAKGDNGIGMAGVAWNVRLMPLVALNGNGSGSTQDIIQALRYAVRMGASVVNLSLAGYEQDPALTEMVQRALDAGVVVVGASGNNDKDVQGTDIDELPSYPVCGESGQDSIIGVGGTDKQDQKAAYANFGKRCTDISAPAYDLIAARPSYARSSSLPDPSVSVPYYREGVGGTSLAAPLTAGAAALLKSIHPSWTVKQIQTRLYTTAAPTSQNQERGTKTVLGYGRLDIGRAVMDDVVPSQADSSSSYAYLAPRLKISSASNKIQRKFLVPLQALVRKLK